MISFTAISAVVGLVPRIIDAVKTAEEYIRGRGRGKEKKEAATEKVIEAIKDSFETAKRMEVPDIKTVNWFKLVLNGPELTKHVGDVVDSIVALMNFLSKFDDVVDTPSDPKLVN